MTENLRIIGRESRSCSTWVNFMKTKINIGEKSYEIEISEIRDRLIKIKVDDEEFIFFEDKSGKLNFWDKKDYPPLGEIEGKEIVCELFAEKEIKSPIAGVISNIFVKEGEEIQPGQKVLTLISMKMENEIIAESCGKIKKIKVKENQFINANDILIVLE
ncbi:hypothetical protein KJA15_02490 [Patescibacteria group bacterium]|nr:hypothetical protein [Patescibacteria group bacterium]